MEEIIDRFVGQYRFLSNFHACDVRLGTIRFLTVEAAYQACKTQVEAKRFAISRMKPAFAKMYGKRLPLPADWQERRVKVMWELLQQKFGSVQHNLGLLSKLNNTGNATLIEGNTWGEIFWGVCDGQGENMLGKLLMQIRQDNRTKFNLKGS